MPAGTLDFVGSVAAAPPALQRLVDDATLERIEVEPTAVLLRLAAARSWRDEGAGVRDALQTALAQPDSWRPAERSTPDDILRAAVQQVIDGDVGDYVRSHGGAVALSEVRGGAVVVRLSGACAHCAASDVTLTERFDAAVRARFPAVTSITAQTDDAPTGGRRRLLLSPLRRP